MFCTKCVSPTSKKRRKSCSFTSFHLDPVYHHSTWILYIIICAYSTRTLTTLVQNLNQFSRIQYRGTAPPPKKNGAGRSSKFGMKKANGQWPLFLQANKGKAFPQPLLCHWHISLWGNFWKLPSFPLRISHVLLYMSFGKKTSWTVRKHKSDTTTINTYHIQDLKNQKSQCFPMNIKIQCTDIKFKTSFVKYTSNIFPCTPPCARGPKCFRPTTSVFFFFRICWTLRLCDVLLANDLLGLTVLHPAVETSPFSLGHETHETRCRVLQGSVFPKKNWREAVIVYGEKKDKKATTYSI